jgi:hypothetical protein
MAAWTEMIANGPLCSEKPLGVARGFEASHRSLTLARWLVRVLRSIVQAFVPAVLHARQHVFFGGCIAAELIGDEHARDVLTPFEQRAEESFGGLLVAPPLHQNIQHLPVLIHGPPKIVLCTIDGEDDFIEMPLVTGLCSPSAQLIGVRLAKSAAPLPDRFIGEYDPARCQQFFQVAIAEGEAILEPNRVTNNLGRETIPLVCG